MSTVILGIDPSSKKLAAAITINETSLEVRSIGLNQKIEIACVEARAWAAGLRDEFILDDLHVFAEAPVVGRGGVYATLRQAKVLGALLAGFNDVATIMEVNNQRWKKEIVGTGRADKPMVKRWCRDSWPNAYALSEGDQDIIDACAINRYGAGVVNRQQRIVRSTNLGKRTFRRTRRTGAA